MSMKRYGVLKSGKAQYLPGRGMDIDLTGIAKLTQKLRCNIADEFVFTPQRSTPHPNYPNLWAQRVRSTWLGLSLLEIEIEYVGVPTLLSLGSNATTFPPPVYNLETSEAVNPIETHPNFAKIGGTGPGILSLNGAVFKPFDPNHLSLGYKFDGFPANAPKQLGGVTQYTSAHYIWRKKYATKDRPPVTELAALQRIQTPEGPFPATPSGNWKFVQCSYEEAGPVFSVEKAWMLSDVGGWNPLIYS